MKTYKYLLNSLICNARRICLTAAALFLITYTAVAQNGPGTPQFFNNFTTNQTNVFPLSSATNKVQWIYSPTLFATGGTGIGTPAFAGNITKVYFKLSGANPAAAYTNFTISLGQNQGTITNWTSSTFVTGLTQCFFQASGFQLTSALSNQWYGITLQTPFLYDPTQSLIFEMKVSAGTGNTVAQQTAGGITRRTGTFTATTGSLFTGLIPFGMDITPATPCTGTPVPGNTVASANPVCPGAIFLLSPQNIVTLGSGNTFQWQTSPDNTTWTNASGASTFSTYTTSQSVSTWYRVVVTCTNSGLTGTSTPVQVITSALTPACYCTSIPTSTIDEEIIGVQVGSMNNPSLCFVTAPGTGSIANRYSNFTTSVPAAALPQSSGVPFSISIGDCEGVGFFSSGVAVFIDYNKNGLLTDPGEKVAFNTSTINGPYVFSGNFTVPITATTGTTLMRVINAEGFPGTSITPCLAFNFGETEDYFVNVIALTPCTGTPNAGTVTVPAGTLCPNTNVVLSASGVTFGTGIVYQWESSTTGCAGSFGPIAGANSTSYSFLSSFTTTSYRMKTTCSNSGLSNFTNCVDVTATLAVSCYCTSTATSTADEEITNVTVGSMNNSSTCGVVAPGPGSLVNRYSNWTTTVPAPNLVQGGGVPFSVTQTSCGGPFNNRTAIFIDYNRNGLLTDVGEMVFMGPVVAGNHTDVGSFVVPATATTGITLMRVKNVETGGTFTACGNFTWGEVEDYFVNIIPPPPFPPACATYNSPADLAADICPATGATLSWSPGAVGGTLGAATSYDVYFGTSPTPPLVTNTSATTFATGVLIGGQTYYWSIVPKNSFGDATGCTTRSFSAASSVAFATGCYCIPVYTNTFSSCFPGGCGCSDCDAITNFTFNGVSFPSTCACPLEYSFVSSPQIPLTQGGTFVISAQPQGTFTEGIKVWIDFNDNGSFEDAGELIWTAGPSAALMTANILIPCSAPPGIHRLRVRVNFASTVFTSCSQQTFGETEDYIVNIAPNLVVATVGTVTVTPTLGCGFLNVPLSATVDNFTGLLQWQFEQPFGANNWVNIAGVTTQTANLVANMLQGNGTISFGLRVRASDCFNNQVFSNSVQFTLDDPAAPTGVTGGARCGPGDITLTATAAAGHSIEWWSAAAGGTLVGTGSSFVFNASATTTLHAANRNPVTGCLGTLRVGATATVHPIPVTAASNNGPLCAAAAEGATALAVLNATGSAPPVPHTLATPVGTNGQSGVMFDVTTTTALTVNSFSTSFINGTWTVNIYYKVGTFIGFETNAGAWTFVGTSAPFTVIGAPTSGIVTPIPLPVNLAIGSGQTYAFYLTLTSGTGMRYGNGTSLGGVLSSDANMTIFQGKGRALPLFTGAQFTPRTYHGSIHYTTGAANTFTWTPAVTCTNSDCSEGTSNLFPSLTPYLYTVTITDVNGCTSSSTTEVTVNKTPNMAALQSATLNGGVAALFPNPPSFLDIPEFTEALSCDKAVNYNIIDLGIPVPTYTHSMSGATVAPGGTSGTGSGSMFGRLIPTGRTTISVISTNVCGSQTKTFRVTITDNVAPVITPIPVAPTNTNAGECASLVQVTQPDLGNGGLFDNCPNASLIFVDRSDGRSQFEPYFAGITTVTWMATDASANVTTASQDVEVTNIKPVITSFTAAEGSLIFVNQTATFTVAFTDEDGGGTHTVKYYRDKNDAIPANVKMIAPICYNSCTGIAAYSVTSDPILYTTSEVAEPKVEILDGCNLAADQIPGVSTIMYLAVAVAGNQFTTAGGHFTIPAGAYPSTYEGYNVSIGNIVKKATSGNSFKGQLEMNVHIPDQTDWRVHTEGQSSNTDITWDYLTIAGCSLATFKGSVRINGQSGYKILVQQSDKDRNPATSNFIRVKITTNGGGLVFDTQPGLTEALTSGNGGAAAIITALDNGSVKVQPSSTQNQACTSRIEGTQEGETLQNLPNPFTGQTEIRFSVPEDGMYTLKVYNYLGQEVTTLFNGEALTGSMQSIMFDGSNLEAGIYNYTLIGINVIETRRMNLIR